MEAFYQHLSLHAATIDELLSDAFEVSPEMAADADLAAQRMAAWRRACAAGDASSFARRLTRDGLSPIEIENRLARSRRRSLAPYPLWIEDAVWIEQAFTEAGQTEPETARSYPFEDLFTALIERAEALVWSGVDACACDYFDERARASLRHMLLTVLSELCAPALYERFAKSRDHAPPSHATPSHATPTNSLRRRARPATVNSSPISAAAVHASCSNKSRCCCD